MSGYLFWPRVPNASGNFHCSSLPVSQVQVIPTVKKNHMDTYEYYDVNRFVQMDFLKICREVVKT